MISKVIEVTKIIFAIMTRLWFSIHIQRFLQFFEFFFNSDTNNYAAFDFTVFVYFSEVIEVRGQKIPHNESIGDHIAYGSAT